MQTRERDASEGHRRQEGLRERLGTFVERLVLGHRDTVWEHAGCGHLHFVRESAMVRFQHAGGSSARRSALVGARG